MRQRRSEYAHSPSILARSSIYHGASSKLLLGYDIDRNQQPVYALRHLKRHWTDPVLSRSPSFPPSSYSILTTAAGRLEGPIRTNARSSVISAASSAPAVRLKNATL